MEINRSRQKRIIAKSTAEYRGVQIYETRDGCVFFMAGRQWSCGSLSEATNMINQIYRAMGKVIEVSPSSG